MRRGPPFATNHPLKQLQSFSVGGWVLGRARAVQRHTPTVLQVVEDRLTGGIIDPAAAYGRYGAPRVVNRSIRTSATLRAVIERAASRATHSRVNSSTTLRHLSGRPAMIGARTGAGSCLTAAGA